MENKFTLKQTVHAEVVRAKTSGNFLKEPIICNYCGNKRFWLIRCEYCGRTEQKIS